MDYATIALKNKQTITAKEFADLIQYGSIRKDNYIISTIWELTSILMLAVVYYLDSSHQVKVVKLEVI